MSKKQKTTDRSDIFTVVESFLTQHDITIQRRGSQWTFTNHSQRYPTKTAAIAAALDQLAAIHAEYKQHYINTIVT